MALLPVLINELLDDYRTPFIGDIYDQNFGMGLLNDAVLTPMSSLMSAPLRCGYLRPWRNLSAGDSGVSTIESNSKEFKVNLDVQQFKPEELKVKVVDDYIVVEGKHEERSDQHGFISRQFTRRYKVPEDVDKTKLISNLSSDGVLSLQAPKLAIPDKASRDIPITQTNKPAIKQKKDKKNEKGEKMEE
ncbi:hypothetical protein O3M35_011026 [Rhynocoris fuscipes]|uniref:SHSP domain-containing protein n=1 Tax=Rhynocoris fuscipes TaxID=488301 RepID=A0AAW1CV30_9HEMI